MPFQADWLNDSSSTPPVSVTIATVKLSLFFPFEDSLSSFSELPHAPSSVPAARTSERASPNLRFFNFYPPNLHSFLSRNVLKSHSCLRFHFSLIFFCIR